MKLRAFATILIATGLGMAQGTARGETVFLDDFEDGSFADHSPVSWEPRVYTQGIYDVVEGAFVLSANSVPLVAIATAPEARNVSIRTQVRVVGESHGIGLFTRGDFEGDDATTYQGGIDTDGGVYIGWNDADTRYHNLVDIATDLRPNNEDVSLQFDVMDNLLTMYAWRANESKPINPLIQVTSNQINNAGNVGLLHHARNGLSTAAFQFVHVASESILDPLGDFTGDGVLNCADIDLVVSQISQGETSLQFDLDGDTLVSRSDIELWLVYAGAMNLPSGEAFLRAMRR